MVENVKSMIAVIDDAEVVVQLMGIEHAAHEIHIHGVIVHDEDGQRSLHQESSSVRVVRPSDKREGNTMDMGTTVTSVKNIARYRNIFQDREILLFAPLCNNTFH